MTQERGEIRQGKGGGIKQNSGGNWAKKGESQTREEGKLGKEGENQPRKGAKSEKKMGKSQARKEEK